MISNELLHGIHSAAAVMASSFSGVCTDLHLHVP
jgi:hypothetical protein